MSAYAELLELVKALPDEPQVIFTRMLVNAEETSDGPHPLDNATLCYEIEDIDLIGEIGLRIAGNDVLEGDESRVAYWTASGRSVRADTRNGLFYSGYEEDADIERDQEIVVIMRKKVLAAIRAAGTAFDLGWPHVAYFDDLKHLVR